MATFSPGQILTADDLNNISDIITRIDNDLEHPNEYPYLERVQSNNLFNPTLCTTEWDGRLTYVTNTASIVSVNTGDYSENAPANTLDLSRVNTNSASQKNWSACNTHWIHVQTNKSYVFKSNKLITYTNNSTGFSVKYGVINFVELVSENGTIVWESKQYNAALWHNNNTNDVIEVGATSSAYYGETYAKIQSTSLFDGIGANIGYKAICIKFLIDGWVRVTIGHSTNSGIYGSLGSGTENDVITPEIWLEIANNFLVNLSNDLYLEFDEYSDKIITKYKYVDKYSKYVDEINDKINQIRSNFAEYPLYSPLLYNCLEIGANTNYLRLATLSVFNTISTNPKSNPTTHALSPRGTNSGKNICSGWIKIVEPGKYTILQFKQITDSHGTFGYIGIVEIINAAGELVYISKHYHTGDEALVGSTQYINSVSKVTNGMSKFTFDKLTDDELYVCWFMSMYQNNTVSGYHFPSADWESTTQEDAETIMSGAMLYKGTKIEKYYSFDTEPIAIDYRVAIDSIDGLRDLLAESGIGTGDSSAATANSVRVMETISIENSDKICFFGNSFFEGYTMLGLHPIVHLGSWLDYILYNYSLSGDDLLETLERVENKSKKFNSPIAPVDFNGTYAVIAQLDNDGALHAVHYETYYENSKKLAHYLLSYGMIPIFGTEHDSNSYYYNMMRLCREEGYMFMDWGLLSTHCPPAGFAPFAHSGHPATRTHWSWTNGMLEFFKTLPRPRKAIKIFSCRDESIAIDNLIYNTNIERAKLWKDFSGGYTYDINSIYFDRLNEKDLGSVKTSTCKSEYMLLHAGDEVTTTYNKILIEIITPFVATHINSIKIYLNTSATKVYIKRNTSMTNALSSKRYLAFGIGDNDPTIFTTGSTIVTSAGTTGHIQGASQTGTFTVQGITNDIVVTTNRTYSETSGTDILEATLNGTKISNLIGSYDYPSADYGERWNVPLSEYIEIGLDENYSFTIDNVNDAKKYFDFDKLAFLLYDETGAGITIADIHAEVSGNGEKNRENHYKIRKPLKGTKILSETNFASNISNWNVTGNISFPSKLTYTAVATSAGSKYTESWPAGSSSIIQLEKGTRLTKLLSGFNRDAYTAPMILIKIIARRMPPVCFTDDNFNNNNVITENYYPCGTLKIGLGASATTKDCDYFGADEIGLWWYTYVYNIPLQTGTDALHILSESDWIQIARIEVNLIDNYILI